MTEPQVLKNRRALITGSYRGLGLQMAKGLAKAGAHVVINGRSRSGVGRAVDELLKAGYKASAARFDIQDESAVHDAIAEIENELGSIDILVNNAGMQKRHLLKDMPLSDFKSILDVNLTSAFLVSREVVQGMIRRRSGKIINVCSLMSDLARPTTGNYAAAKGGLRMLTRAMACEWAQYDIQVNGIAPGYFATEMTLPLLENPSFNEWICSRTPAGRWGKAEELEGIAVFFASKASSFINGQVVYVDGALSCVI